MALFRPENRTKSLRNRRLYAAYELAYTLVDFSAAMLFLVGSVLFFYKSLETPAIWCFVIGSVCFALKPTLRIVRELHYVYEGDLKDVAERAES